MSENPVFEPLLLTPKEAARALAISPRTLWTLTASREIPCVRIRKNVRYQPADLAAFVAKQLASSAERS